MGTINQQADGTYVVKSNKKINILAFIGCLLLSFIVWIYVTNVKINDNTKTFSIKMDIKGESSLLDEKFLSVFGASETWVKVTVQGSNAELQKYSEKDFKVYIDVSNIEKPGITPLNVVVETPGTSVAVISTDPVQTTVFVDEKVSNVKIPLKALTKNDNESLPKDYKVSIEEINLSGPKTSVDRIAYAQIIVDIYNTTEGNSDNLAFSAVRFFDETDQIIESPYLIYDSSIITVKKLSQDTVGADTSANQNN